MENQKLCVMGLGYIGLPTAALLATKGYHVHGVDVKPEVIDSINKGIIQIVEPELDAFVKSAVQSGNLQVSLKPDFADVFIIAVPAQVDNNNEPDIAAVMDAAKAIIPYVKEGNFVILESTSPVGTTEKLVDLFKEQGVDTSNIQFAYSPERVLSGQTMRELVENDRVVGGTTKEAAIHVALFYEAFIQGEVIVTNSRTAEMSKLAENAFRDVNIAYANELSVLCDKFGINIWELISLANRHPRVNILRPGSGVGGHFIANDPWFIVADGKEDARIIKAAREINNMKPAWVIGKIEKIAAEFRKSTDKKPRIACLGITYKPDVDDLRESSSFYIVQNLIEKGLDIIICEPNIRKHSNLKLSTTADAIAQADIVVFLVAHKEFRGLEIPKDKTVLDVCGINSKYGRTRLAEKN